MAILSSWGNIHICHVLQLGYYVLHHYIQWFEVSTFALDFSWFFYALFYFLAINIFGISILLSDNTYFKIIFTIWPMALFFIYFGNLPCIILSTIFTI